MDLPNKELDQPNMELDLMADKLIEYLEKLKVDCSAKADHKEKILAELGYDIKTDLPPAVHRHFDALANNNQLSGLNEDGIPDEIESMMDDLAVNKLGIKLKKQIKIVDAMIQDLEKEEIHLNRELKKSQEEADIVEDKAIDAMVKAELLRGKMQRYATKLQNAEQSNNIVSKYEQIKNLHEKRQYLKKEIAEAELKLEKYCGLPPNIDRAMEVIVKQKKINEALKTKLNLEKMQK